MAFTQDIFSSRRNYADGSTRIGETGRLWYDSVTNTLRVGDGSTPGGILVSGGGGGGGGLYTLIGSVSTSTDLPGYPSSYGGAVGDAYLVLDTDFLWVWDGSAWRDLGGIQGATGPQGVTGATGAKGDVGDVGATGAASTVAGATGSTGPKGDTGDVGATGADSTVPGATGDVGATGEIGATGANGATGASGDSGATGASGDSGATGATGIQGNVLVSDTAPSPANTGDVWFDDISGRLYINYDNTWVDVYPSINLYTPRMPNYANDTAANTAVGTPLNGMQYYNTTTDKAMVYTASGWQAMN